MSYLDNLRNWSLLLILTLFLSCESLELLAQAPGNNINELLGEGESFYEQGDQVQDYPALQ